MYSRGGGGGRRHASSDVCLIVVDFPTGAVVGRRMLRLQEVLHSSVHREPTHRSARRSVPTARRIHSVSVISFEWVSSNQCIFVQFVCRVVSAWKNAVGRDLAFLSALSILWVCLFLASESCLFRIVEFL